MKNRFATIFFVRACRLLAIAVLCVPPLGAATASPRLPGTPHPAVVRVIVPEKGATSYGSGTLVNVRDQYGLVITNWHVVRDAAGTIEVVFPDGFRSAARALKVDQHWDLAALVIWRPNVQSVPIASTAPRPGDALTIAGYGQGNYRAAMGQCTQYVAPGANLPFEMVEVNVEARQGDSGGPIFNDRGELAGVLFGAGRGTTSGSYCGRVGGFLASLTPDMGTPDMGTPDMGKQSETQIASSVPSPPMPAWTASQPAGRMSELAVVNPPPRQASTSRTEFRPATVQPEPAVVALTTAPKDLVPESAGLPITWHDVAGETFFEQAKTVLAAIGAGAMLLLIVRFTS